MSIGINAFALVQDSSLSRFPECKSSCLQELIEAFVLENPTNVFYSGDDEPLYIEDLVTGRYQMAEFFLNKIRKSSCPLVVIWNRPRKISYLLPNWNFISEEGLGNERVQLSVVVAEELKRIGEALIGSEVFVVCRNHEDVSWVSSDNINPRSGSYLNAKSCGPLFYLQGICPGIGLSVVNLENSTSASAFDFRNHD